MDPVIEPAARPATRGRRVPAISGDDRERAILIGTERLLGERSYAELSVDDLAKSAGISRPTFYFYFASKEQVLLSLFDKVLREARANRGDVLLHLDQGEEKGWRAAIGAFVATFAAHRAVASAALAAQFTSPAVQEQWSQVMDQFVGDALAAIESERRRGAAPDGIPARDLATSLSWMVERNLFASFAGQGPAVAEERLLDTLVSIYMLAVYQR
ncbi:TetR/AcrR family transcriptional regulator [Nocardia sp. NPDC056611]|uniref:TetR/AcrR family transcriptional regulator n=1 Tax=Nocardia sp. NPDC056611 TaxID=3345877 RepID=UPI00367143E1